MSAPGGMETSELGACNNVHPRERSQVSTDDQ
jgi:hypothetical protein